MKLKYFDGCTSLDEVKQLYKKLAMQYHPDREGGDKAIMQEINLEYESIRKNPMFKYWKKTEETRKDFVEFPEIINKIIGLQGIVKEVCGRWLYISGQTYKYRSKFKDAGFTYSNDKKLWYFRPKDQKSNNREPHSMDYIRKKFGSDVFTQPTMPELEPTNR